MRGPIVFGIVAAVVIAVLGIMSPVLRDSASKTAEQAQEEAALARRELARYSVSLPRVAALFDPAELEQTDLGPLVEKPEVAERLREAASEYARLVRGAEESARAHDLPAPELPALAANAAGVKRALGALKTTMRENDALLQKAISDAKAATGTDGGALGVSQVLGMAEYVRAAGLLVEAQALRIRQTASQAELLGIASQRRLAQGYLAHFRGLNVAPILARLRADLEELATLRTEAAERVAVLAAQVTEREDALTGVEQALASRQQNLLALEARGFTAGQDDGPNGFNWYRQRFLEISLELRELAQRQQELQDGGQPGARLVGPDPVSASIEGGQPIQGLDELRWRLATARERARRLDSANLSLEEHVRYVGETDNRARSDAATYEQRLEHLRGEQLKVAKEILALAGQAHDKEEAALQAANKAVSAFSQAQRAAQAWMRAAKDAKSDKDPASKNERLLIVTRDPYFEQVSSSAEAAARILAGRVLAQQVESNQRLIGDMQLVSAMDPGFEFDASEFQSVAETARGAGLETLEQAGTTYNTIAQRLSNQPTAWVPTAALATVQHLMARVDPSQAELFGPRAFEFIRQATDQRELFPYAKAFVLLRDHLAGTIAGPAPAPAVESAPEPEEEDFFLDDEEGEG